MGTITNFLIHGEPALYKYVFYDQSIIIAENEQEAIKERMNIGDKYWRTPDWYMNIMSRDPLHHAALRTTGKKIELPDFGVEKTHGKILIVGGSGMEHLLKRAFMDHDLKFMNEPIKITRPKMATLPEPPGLAPQYFRPEKKIGNNDPCSCGSGKKFKNCCKT